MTNSRKSSLELDRNVLFFFSLFVFSWTVSCVRDRDGCCPRLVILTVVVQLGACHRLTVPHVYLRKWLVLVVTLVFLGMKFGYEIQ